MERLLIGIPEEVMPDFSNVRNVIFTAVFVDVDNHLDEKLEQRSVSEPMKESVSLLIWDLQMKLLRIQIGEIGEKFGFKISIDLGEKYYFNIEDCKDGKCERVGRIFCR